LGPDRGWGSFLGSDAPSVLTRIGDEKADTRLWSQSSDKTASFLSGDRVGFIKKMMMSDKFVAQVTPYSSNPITAVFDTAGLSEAIKPVQEVCRWP
jgi:type VI secretion system protein VasI